MFISRIAFPLLAAVMAVPAFAEVVDDAVKMAAGGVSDEVMISWAERQSGHEISAADIVSLKGAKVPDRVIIALIRRSGEDEMAIAPQQVQRREVVRQQPVRQVQVKEREVIRYVDAPSTTYDVTPGVELASYYYPSYSSRYYNSYPRYYSSGYSYPRYYHYSPHSYYPRYGGYSGYSSRGYIGGGYGRGYGSHYGGGRSYYGGYGSHYGGGRSYYGGYGSHYGGGRSHHGHGHRSGFSGGFGINF